MLTRMKGKKKKKKEKNSHKDAIFAAQYYSAFWVR